MIGLIDAFYHALWILGLALVLGVLSVAEYRAGSERASRLQFAEPGRQALLLAGVSLFCLGLALGSGTWWERSLWGLLALVTAAQTVRLWRRLLHRDVAVARADAAMADTAAESRVSREAAKGSRWLGWGLVLAGMLVLALWTSITAVQAAGHARSLQRHLQALEQIVDLGGDPQAAGRHLTGMREDLMVLQTQVGPVLPAGRLLGWVPRYGGDLSAAADLLEMAADLSVAGDGAFRALLPAMLEIVGERGQGKPAPPVGERVLPMLAAAQPELEAAQAELEAVRVARGRVSEQSLSPRVAGYLQHLDGYLPWFETAVDAALLAPDLLGSNGPRTYLILAQNNDELRPTGGFISGVGELRLEEGRIASLRFTDSYAVDNPEMPRPVTPSDLQQTLFGELWFFRDANWDADFPTSAQRALAFYANDRGVPADGVIALDLVALQGLVEALGPLQVPGIKDAVTGDNVLEIIQARWAEPQPGVSQAQSEAWWLHRKDSMGEIAGAAMERLVGGRDLPLADLARALRQALDEKHILIHLRDPVAAGLLRERGWSGDLPDPLAVADSLLVVDTNVGFNKVDANVARSLDYEVDLSDEDVPRARLSLTYEHRGATPVEHCIQQAEYDGSYADMMDRCYWNYVRVYVPAGSQLLAGPDIPLPGGSLLARYGDAASHQPIAPVLSDGGLTAWTSFFDLAPGAQRALVFEYRLPAGVLNSGETGLAHYVLRIQKQPGTGAVPLRVRVLLPEGAELLAARPEDLPWQQGAAPGVAHVLAPGVATDLRTDRVFEIFLRAKERP